MWFEELIRPLTPQQFLSGTRGVDWCRSEGLEGRFGNLMSMPHLERWLSEVRWDPERIYLVKNGRRFEPATYLFNPEAARGCRPIGAVVNRLMDEGGTLVVNAVDETRAEIATLAEELEDLFDVHIGINLYATRGGEQGFEAHWDDHDVFVIQIAGRKKWKVWKPTVVHPLPVHSGRVAAPTEEVWSGELKDGDVLYLPRGWWHWAQGVGSESVHLAVGVQEPTGYDLLQWALRRFADSPVFGRSLPLRADNAASSLWIKESGAILAAAWNADLLTEFRDERARKGVARPRMSLASSVAAPAAGTNGNGGGHDSADAREGRRIRLAQARRLLVRPRGDRQVDLIAGRTVVRCLPEVAELLEPMRNTAPLDVSEVMRAADARGCANDMRRVLRVLALADQIEHMA